MIGPTQLPPPPDAPLKLTYEPRRSRGRCWGAYLAWAVILIVAIGIPILHLVRPRASLTVGVEAVPASIDVQTTIMGKYVVAATKFSAGSKTAALAEFAAQAKTPEALVANAVLIGELGDMDKARALLHYYSIAGTKDPSAPWEFERTYATGQSLPADIHERYGFFARLAQVQGKPDDDPARAKVLREANRTFGVMVGAMVVFIGAGALGLALLITAIVLGALGKIQLRPIQPVGPANVYVEAFAIYLGGAMTLSLAMQLLVPTAPLWVMLLPLPACVIAALLWPLLRGVSARQVRDDWGISAGGNFFVEVIAGIGGYLAGLPILAIGFGIMLILMKYTGTTTSHPAVELLAKHPLLVFLLASVFAPITEELMFRGALLTHLRRRLGPVVSGLIVGLIFAAVHPQGWVAIPVIGAIGFVLSMIRQWRGSLVAPIVAHALNNTVVLTLGILLAG